MSHLCGTRPGSDFAGKGLVGSMPWASQGPYMLHHLGSQGGPRPPMSLIFPLGFGGLMVVST